MCISAGNEASMGYNALNWASLYEGLEAAKAECAYYGTVASPSTYGGNLSIASVENIKYPSSSIQVGETFLPITDSCTDESMKFASNFGGQTLQYVMAPEVGSIGTEDPSYTTNDFEGLDLTGRIAAISRGTIDFESKVENAANAGAVGVAIYDNQPGIILMSIETFEVPAVSVPMEAKDIL